MKITLTCPVCGFDKVLRDRDQYTQADLMCPSDQHPETELIRSASQADDEDDVAVLEPQEDTDTELPMPPDAPEPEVDDDAHDEPPRV